MKIQSAKISLRGDREENQDRAEIIEDGSRILLALGDGMGGHSDGGEAAQALIEAAQDGFSAAAGNSPPQALQSICEEAHHRITNLHPDLPDVAQPRTTAVFCLFNGPTALFAHAGDSRAYQFRGGRVLTRTRDHSVVEVLARTGRIRHEDTKTHPLRSQVSRCLGGFGSAPRLEFSPTQAVEVGDLFLICSDGLWEPLDDEGMAQMFETADLQQALDDAGREAISVHPGYADNCTALLVRIESLEV